MAPAHRLPKILVLRDGREVRTLAGARALILGLPEALREKPHWEQATELVMAGHVDHAYLIEVSAQLKAALKAEGMI
jgi:hypothetical protein